MNILVLEDRGSAIHFFLRWLKAEGHNVLGRMGQGAFNINDANAIWNRRDEVPIHCMIIDLDVPRDGLSDQQEAELARVPEGVGSRLTGWIWLRDTVLRDAPEMRDQTIIYSDYIELMVQFVPEREYYGITLTRKRARGSSADVVVNRIQAIKALPPLTMKSREGDEQ